MIKAGEIHLALVLRNGSVVLSQHLFQQFHSDSSYSWEIHRPVVPLLSDTFQIQQLCIVLHYVKRHSVGGYRVNRQHQWLKG